MKYMENPEFLPIQQHPGIYADGTWTFNINGKYLDINNLGSEIIEVLKLANGYITDVEIIDQLIENGQEEEITKNIIIDLKKLDILGDSREQLIEFHKLTTNPSPFNRQISSRDIVEITNRNNFTPRLGERTNYSKIETIIGSMALNRESCRNFLPDSIGADMLMTCLDSGYSKDKHPVPSAGGLYPLRMYSIVRNGGEIPNGYYQYDHQDGDLIKTKDDVDWEKLKHIFNSEDLLHNAPIILVISADLSIHSEKYSNRGYRYSILEAGHVAQNIHLVANELGLSTLEYGGFNDNKLSSELDLLDTEVPLITLALGYENKEELSSSLFDSLLKMEDYIGEDRPIDWAVANTNSKKANILDFYHASAKYKAPNIIYPDNPELYSSGTANSIDLARIKAIAEAYERYTAGILKYDIISSSKNLREEWLDPRTIKPLSDYQYEKLDHLINFNPETPIQWIRGRKHDGSSVLVPVDLVFYPLNEVLLGRKRIVDNDSSGMAAHPDINIAIKNAILELIERDATMQLWFSKKSPNKIDHKMIPGHIIKRIDYWKSIGRNVDILDLSNNGVAIINVIIRSINEDYPFMVSGASASFDSFDAALNKAFTESELGYANAMLSDKKLDWVEADKVRSPEDHGRFYYYDYAKSAIEWLWSGSITNILPKTMPNKDYLNEYEPIIVKLTDDKDYLQVVRVLCKKLIPINFGINNEYYSHPSVVQNNRTPEVPHFFA